MLAKKRVTGKVWKQQQPALPLTKNKISATAWDRRLLLRSKNSILKTIKTEYLAEKELELKMKKERLENARKRKEENEKKAEIVVSVSAAKVKRMKRKQLRLLRKA
jgi:hypothetical protein